MGRRYYCDYCNRSFLDDINSRKKHLNSTNHIRNKKAHYTNFRDLKTLIFEESQKEECKRFKHGQCLLGDNCNFTHYSKLDLEIFSIEAELEEERLKEEAELPSVEDWLRRREDSSNSSTPTPGALHQMTPSSSLVAAGYDAYSLPPSLLPLTVHQARNAQFETWG